MFIIFKNYEVTKNLKLLFIKIDFSNHFYTHE